MQKKFVSDLRDTWKEAMALSRKGKQYMENVIDIAKSKDR